MAYVIILFFICLHFYVHSFIYLSRRAWIRLISLRTIIICKRDVKSADDGAPSNL